MIQDWQSLSLLEQIAQMIVVRASGHLFDSQIRYPAWEANNQQLETWLSDFNLGGVILLGGSSVELQARSQQLQSWANTPLFVAADIEEGIGQRFPGGTWFPPPMALGSIYRQDPELAQQYAYQMGEITAQEALTLGVNWLLAPVVDVNNNPANPAINIRAFGDCPKVVSSLATAFIRGAKSTKVLTTAKHFPGHGDTVTDSHLDLPALHHSQSRLGEIELPPFQAAIAAGVDSVMTAHLLIPAWDEEQPATLSAKIVTEILRNRLSFSGLVVTDALIMGGITKFASPEVVAVKAVEAGTDILLMPDDPKVAIAAIYDAVQTGRITEARIHQSLARIWHKKKQIVDSSIVEAELYSDRAKLAVKTILENSQRTSQDFFNKVLCPSSPPTLRGTRNGSPNSSNRKEDFEELGDLSITNETSQTTFQQSDRLSTNKADNSDLTRRNLIVIDDVLNTTLDFNHPAIAIPEQYKYQRQLVDRHTLDCILLNSRPTLLQIFIRGNPFRGTAGLTNETKKIYRQLSDRQQLIGLVIYGSPYVWEWFQSTLEPQFPAVFTYGQMPQAQAIALGKLFPNSDNLLSSQSSNFGF